MTPEELRTYTEGMTRLSAAMRLGSESILAHHAEWLAFTPKRHHDNFALFLQTIHECRERAKGGDGPLTANPSLLAFRPFPPNSA